MKKCPEETWDQFDDRCERAGECARDHHWTRQTESKPMAMIGDYLLQLLERCSDQQFGQDAIQFGITLGLVELTYNLEADCRLIMGEPGHPETGKYDELCEAWRRECAANHEQLVESYLESGLLEEILRPLPLHGTPPSGGRVQTPAEEAA